MGHALLVYNNSAAGVNDANVDMTAAVDADFSQRNSHYVFTNRFRLMKAWAIGASMIRARFQVPTWNALGEWSLFNVNRGIEPTANTQCDSYLPMMPRIPINEEFQVQGSNNLGSSTEIESVGIQLATDDWTPALPQGLAMFTVKTTFTVTHTLNAWSGPQALTFTSNLRGGVYAVVGAQLQADDCSFFRTIFPRYKLYGGQRLRPGGPVQNAVGNVTQNQSSPWNLDMGEWGRFHTFELPQCETFGTAADSTACVLYLTLVFLGEDVSLLQGGMGGGGVSI